MNTAVQFSSQTDLWVTPQDFFDGLNNEFSFETDVCANQENAKCLTWYGIKQNGLAQEWIKARAG